jgi:hypothetical protein
MSVAIGTFIYYVKPHGVLLFEFPPVPPFFPVPAKAMSVAIGTVSADMQPVAPNERFTRK